MLNAIIIEDERPALENLTMTLAEVAPEVRINAVLGSVRESIDYLSGTFHADIIFCDVQLPDGLSFEIFSETQLKVPVIFITGYDEFLMNAFEYNAIDYLLKPVDKADLRKALFKYKMLEAHFMSNSGSLSNLTQLMHVKRKTRLIVKKGIENISIKLDDVVFFYTENKIVYVVDKTGKKYMTDKNLGDLELELDDSVFFRANRQYIINLNYVKGFKTYEKVKLQIDLILPELNHCIIISQETAPAFRKWIYEA